MASISQTFHQKYKEDGYVTGTKSDPNSNDLKTWTMGWGKFNGHVLATTLHATGT